MIFVIRTSAYSQQADGFVVLNYSPGTCKLQIEYWINNHTNGNGSMFIAIADVGFQWDSSLFTVAGVYSALGGLNLSDTLAPRRDIDSFSTRTVNGSTFRTLDILRSTMYCSNMYEIPNQTSKPLATLTLQFRNCNDAYSYNFTDTTATNYIADINDGTHDPSPYRKVLLIVNKSTRPIDGSGSKCTGTVDSKNLNNVPIGDTTNTLFVPQAPLATGVLNFIVTRNNNKAVLQWQTTEELNNFGFEIQRKKDGDFKPIGFVKSTAIADANRIPTHTYTFVDSDLLGEGTIFYRLKEESYSGNEIYSEIKFISIGKPINSIVYPNPGYGELNIELNGEKHKILLFDISGKLLKSFSNIYSQNFIIRNLNKGFYLLNIISDVSGNIETHKIIVF